MIDKYNIKQIIGLLVKIEMSTYRIYVGSRGRHDPTNNTNEDCELALSFSISVVEISLAMIDVVCVPNSILTVAFNKTDTMFG